MLLTHVLGRGGGCGLKLHFLQNSETLCLMQSVVCSYIEAAVDMDHWGGINRERFSISALTQLIMLVIKHTD